MAWTQPDPAGHGQALRKRPRNAKGHANPRVGIKALPPGHVTFNGSRIDLRDTMAIYGLRHLVGIGIVMDPKSVQRDLELSEFQETALLKALVTLW